MMPFISHLTYIAKVCKKIAVKCVRKNFVRGAITNKEQKKGNDNKSAKLAKIPDESKNYQW